MLSRIRELDGTRPVTTAVSHDPINCAVLDDVDVIGVNYNMEQIDAIHAKYPDKPFISTENCATGTTRGWYLADARGYIRGYDHDTNKSFLSREHTWQAFMAVGMRRVSVGRHRAPRRGALAAAVLAVGRNRPVP